MDLTKLSNEQLESMAYKQVKILEQTRTNIAIIEQELAKRQKPVEVKDEAAS